MAEDKLIIPLASAEAAESTPAPDRPASPKALAPSSPKSATRSEPPKKSAKRDEVATADAKAAPPKPATASREDNLTYDLKHLAAYDIAPLNPKVNFMEYTRDSVQLLVNKLFLLPQVKSEEGVLVTLPEQELFRLPRSKPVPKEKPKTRWQKFMEERNMTKKKRSKMVWDEVSGDWKPRWGYKSVKKGGEEDHFLEVKPGDDPNENPFEKKKAEKNLLKARQKMREVRNKVEALGGKLRASTPDLSKGWGPGGAKRGKDGLREAVKRAQASSASMGKFDRVAPNEATNLQPKKRKGIGVSSTGDEKERYMKAATRILSGQGGVDSAKAAKVGLSQDKRGGAAGKAGKGGGKGGQGKRRSKQGGKKRKR